MEHVCILIRCRPSRSRTIEWTSKSYIFQQHHANRQCISNTTTKMKKKNTQNSAYIELNGNTNNLFIHRHRPSTAIQFLRHIRFILIDEGIPIFFSSIFLWVNIPVRLCLSGLDIVFYVECVLLHDELGRRRLWLLFLISMSHGILIYFSFTVLNIR